MSEDKNPFNEKVLEHFRNPKNVGTMDHPDGTARKSSAICGDIMEIYIKVEEGVITDAKFKTFGCWAAIASSSVVTELVKGKRVEEALKISDQDIARELGGIPPIKMHCSTLAKDTLFLAIDDYMKKRRG